MRVLVWTVDRQQRKPKTGELPKFDALLVGSVLHIKFSSPLKRDGSLLICVSFEFQYFFHTIACICFLFPLCARRVDRRDPDVHSARPYPVPTVILKLSVVRDFVCRLRICD